MKVERFSLWLGAALACFLIIFCSYLDSRLFGSLGIKGFWEFVLSCAWELLIFVAGVFTGFGLYER